MRGRTWIVWIAVVALAAAFVVALARPKNDSGSLPTSGDVTNTQLLALQKSGALVVDVRTAAEYEGGHVAGAENVPIEGFTQAAQAWDRAAPVVVYCATGARSLNAAQWLSANGFQHVYDLTAGIVAWDGELSHEAATGVAQAPSEPTKLPVFYEFFTGW